MNKFLNISEAGALSLHTAVVLAENMDKRLSAKDIAAQLQASEAHLAKIMQRLVQEGMVDSRRGPKGGFSLSQKGLDATLLDFLQAINGGNKHTCCLFDKPVCSGQCVLGGLINQVDSLVLHQLGALKVKSFTKLP